MNVEVFGAYGVVTLSVQFVAGTNHRIRMATLYRVAAWLEERSFEAHEAWVVTVRRNAIDLELIDDPPSERERGLRLMRAARATLGIVANVG